MSKNGDVDKNEARGSEQPGRVLVVEDDLTLLETLEYNLSREGYRVVTAADGLAALDVARAERPDLVVLDVMLPGMDGFEVCRTLRRETNVPILMLTARADEEIGEVGYFPASAEALDAARQAWLEAGQ